LQLAAISKQHTQQSTEQEQQRLQLFHHLRGGSVGGNGKSPPKNHALEKADIRRAAGLLISGGTG